jgi:hypothetical protein
MFGIYCKVEQASRLLSASGRSAGGGKRPGRSFYFLPKHIRIWYEKGTRNFKGSLSSNFKNRNHPSRPQKIRPGNPERIVEEKRVEI